MNQRSSPGKKVKTPTSHTEKGSNSQKKLNAVSKSDMLLEEGPNSTLTKMLARVEKSHSGPLPAPEDYREYENILPGSANRILKMAEEITYSQTTDIKEKRKIESRNSLLGLMFSFIIVLVVLGIAFFSLLKGLNIISLGIILAELASLVIAFVYKAKTPKEEPPKIRKKSKEISK